MDSWTKALSLEATVFGDVSAWCGTRCRNPRESEIERNSEAEPPVSKS